MAMIAAVPALGACALLGYFRYRRSMTCHFCGRYAGKHLPSALPGSWYCPFDDCGQYNGFTLNGDYDRSLPELSDPAYNFHFSHCQAGSFRIHPPILCSQCQCEQGLKIRAIARAETSADAVSVENRFKLCSSCKSAVSSRLKTVNQRIRCSYTSFEISNAVKTSARSVATVSIVCLGVDLMLIWLALVPLFAIFHLPIVLPFSSLSVSAYAANHECYITMSKLFFAAIAYRRFHAYLVTSVIDVVLTLSLHGLLVNLISVQLPNFNCHPSDTICVYRLWAVLFRCIGLGCHLFDIANIFLTKTKVQIARQQPLKSHPFALPSTIPVFKNGQEPCSKPDQQTVLSESGIRLSQDVILNDLLALEGSKSCAVEDMFAGISISRSGDDSLISNTSPSPNSFLNTSCVFIAATILFVINAQWSHWSISCLYTVSLLVLLAVGRSRPLTVPFTAMLLLRQFKSLSNFGSLISEFLVKFGLDVAGLSFLGVIFFVDWSALSQKFLANRSCQSLSQEA